MTLTQRAQARPCPDCVAPLGQHDPTCPALRALEERTDDDRAWFDAHPKAVFRMRPLHRGEVLQLHQAGVVVPGLMDLSTWRVRVFLVAPYVWRRQIIAPQEKA